jgi:hypothetical protein
MTHTTYSVVIKYYYNGTEAKDWNEIVDSTSKSGATRKANNLVNQACGKVTDRQRNDNYQYWKVEV